MQHVLAFDGDVAICKFQIYRSLCWEQSVIGSFRFSLSWKINTNRRPRIATPRCVNAVRSQRLPQARGFELKSCDKSAADVPDTRASQILTEYSEMSSHLLLQSLQRRKKSVSFLFVDLVQ